MKIYIYIMLLLALPCQAQITKRDIAPLALTFAAGMFDGTAESLKFHYEKVDRYGLNDKFWNPEISWQNKYKNGNPDEGPAYFGSTTFLVGFTDGYHLMRSFRNTFTITAISIKIGDKQPWWHYIIEAIAYYLSYQIGFSITYDLIF